MNQVPCLADGTWITMRKVIMNASREQLSVGHRFRILIQVHNGMRVASGSAQTSSTRWRVESAQNQVEQDFQIDTSRNRGVRCACKPAAERDPMPLRQLSRRNEMLTSWDFSLAVPEGRSGDKMAN
jgi:hypothetical protein